MTTRLSLARRRAGASKFKIWLGQGPKIHAESNGKAGALDAGWNGKYGGHLDAEYKMARPWALND